MNEITKIHLGRQAFTISVDAHKVLESYLEAIKRRVGAKSKDVVDEVELRIAELLAERGVTADKVILRKDVEFIKEQLGKPDDFSDEADDGTEEEPSTTAPKRLFRDPEHGLIAGVAAGLAAYLKIDTVFVRLGFVGLTLVWGWGVVLYIILWLIMPELKTKSDRLRAQGKAVTVSSLKSIVERADVPGAANRVTRTVRGVVQTCLRLLLTVTGIGFVIAGIAALLGVMTAGAYMLLRPEQAFQQDLFLRNGTEAFVMVLAVLAAAIICAFLLLIGMSMVRRRWTLPGWIVATMVGLFLASVSVGAALTPGIVQDVHQRYEAAHHTKHTELQPFTKLQLQGDYNTQVAYVPSANYSVDFRYFGDADPTSLDLNVADNLLTINPERFKEAARCKAICLYDDPILKITIYAPSLQDVTIEGSGVSFTVDRALNQPSLALHVEKGSYVNLQRVHPGVVEWNSPIGSTDHLLLSDLRSDATSDDYLGIAGSLTLNRTDELRLQTDMVCGIYGNPVHVMQAPKKIAINGKAYVSVEALRADQSTDKDSAANCVKIESPVQ